MISDSLPKVKLATYCVLLQEPKYGGRIAPAGSGFFVSPDGWFVTARHLFTVDGDRSSSIRDDAQMIGLANPLDGTAERECSLSAQLVFSSARSDFALLKRNHRKARNYRT